MRTDEPLRSDGAAEGEQWLVYRHTPPTTRDWQEMLDVQKANQQITSQRRDAIRPQLISDFCAYDTGLMRGEIRIWAAWRSTASRYAGHALGRGPGGRVRIADRQARREMSFCGWSREAGSSIVRLSVATGQATLTIPGRSEYHATAQTTIVGPGIHRVAFANFDNQLYLWVDRGTFSRGEVTFDLPTTYDDLDNHVPNTEDLTAVRIGSRRGGAAWITCKCFATSITSRSARRPTKRG